MGQQDRPQHRCVAGAFNRRKSVGVCMLILACFTKKILSQSECKEDDVENIYK